jgi:hypothetical protein
VADDIRELNALIKNYGREFQSPDRRRGPSLGSSRLYADYQPATSSEQTEMLLSMLPGVGEGLDVANLVQDLENREYGQAGLSGLAMVLPGVGAATIKKIGENLPKNKQGLSSINIDDELFKDVLKTPEGDPVILYRGSGIDDSVEDAILSGKSRDNYATFMSDSPYLAETYAPTPDNIFPDEVGVVTPFVVKPKKLIEYEDKYTRQNKVKPGSTLSFDKFEFDRQAQNLSPGEVLVARDVHDVGPRAVVTGPDDPKYFSYASDVYATKDPSVLQSPFSAKEVVEKSRVSIFPKPERMFDEGSRPSGGEYIDPKTNDVLTGKNISSANISVKEGRPAFTGIADDVAEVGSSGKGTFKTKTNLFKKSAGWKWMDGPEEYADLPTLVSVQQKGKHYYTVDADFPAGVNLTRYADSPSEPRLRPTLQAQPVELGDVIGTISVRGKEHPVYNRIVAKAAGGLVQRNPYNYEPKAI